MYNTKIIKSSNYDRILECIYRNPGISRKEISDLTGITPATVTTTVSTMFTDGIVTELGRVEEDRGTIGRARIALDIVADFGFTIGVEFTFTALTTCAADMHGKLLYFHSIPYSKDVGEHITQLIIENIQACMDSLDAPMDRLLGIGIGVPGHMDHNSQYMVSTNDDWKNFDGVKIRDAFSCPVVFENNIRCVAVAQYLHNPQQAPSSFAVFHIGQGMFCANVTEEGLYIGNTYGSGEVGHTVAILDGKRCKCGKRGCLETVATEGAILEGAIQIFEYNPNSLLHNFAACAEELTIEHVVAAYVAGDAYIRRFITQTLRYIGITTLNIAILMNPEKLFLHGRLFNHPEIQSDLMEMVQKEFDFTGNNYRLGSVDFLPYSAEDGAQGASALAIWKCVIHA